MRSEKREKKPAPSLRGNRSSNCFSVKSSKGGREGKKRKKGACRSEGSRDQRSRRGSATKETVTGSGAAREEAVLPGSSPGHSWLAAALSAAKGHRPGTARGWRSGTGPLAETAAGLAAPWNCGDYPYSELGLRKDGDGGSSMSAYSRKPERARS
uniref:Uncharacterized protein n=1 Tax=Aotus nancymaae TaxID=37293 RepID=A0A2K5F3H7_AOTNA